MMPNNRNATARERLRKKLSDRQKLATLRAMIAGFLADHALFEIKQNNSGDLFTYNALMTWRPTVVKAISKELSTDHLTSIQARLKDEHEQRLRELIIEQDGDDDNQKLQKFVRDFLINVGQANGQNISIKLNGEVAIDSDSLDPEVRHKVEAFFGRRVGAIRIPSEKVVANNAPTNLSSVLKAALGHVDANGREDAVRNIIKGITNQKNKKLWTNCHASVLDTVLVWNIHAKLAESYAEWCQGPSRYDTQTILCEKLSAVAGGLLVHNQLSRPVLTEDVLEATASLFEKQIGVSQWKETLSSVLAALKTKRNKSVAHAIQRAKVQEDNPNTGASFLALDQARLSSNVAGLCWQMPSKPSNIDLKHLFAHVNGVSSILLYDLGFKSYFRPTDAIPVNFRRVDRPQNSDPPVDFECNALFYLSPSSCKLQLALRDAIIVRDVAQTVCNISQAGTDLWPTTHGVKESLVELSFLAANILHPSILKDCPWLFDADNSFKVLRNRLEKLHDYFLGHPTQRLFFKKQASGFLEETNECLLTFKKASSLIALCKTVITKIITRADDDWTVDRLVERSKKTQLNIVIKCDPPSTQVKCKINEHDAPQDLVVEADMEPADDTSIMCLTQTVNADVRLSIEITINREGAEPQVCQLDYTPVGALPVEPLYINI
ncbi:uncharacterized protein MONBRDRAFT_38557 [Monosiga brevicollis MX1]|uniref:Uncharacterized protein n=1 Tax=Monosiga brevicollis TaxID=81824 RepID=A9V8R1_MONBE|nr:uncharacterized protein MONBRDRAFT_38557 [Monosiga brevicollis MX1]EDQ86188.1 predicted protein [Monosiga brevicollis MX1]|eukprot:XP_001749113.1 hypothetical protein [Monosiga brevicollis MX1]